MTEEQRGPNRIVRKRKGNKKKIRWGRIFLAIIILILLIGGLGWAISKAYQAVVSFNAAEENVIVEEKKNVSTVAVEQKGLDKPIYILLVGKDENSPAEGNALYLLSINVNAKQVDVIGIPGNTKIDNHHTQIAESISDIFKNGNIELTKAVVEDLFHISIPYYIVVDKGAFYKTIDVAGTPNFYVEKEMYHEDGITGAIDVNLAQGYQSMNSQKSYEYVRYIEPHKDGFFRVERQERWLKSFLGYQNESWVLTRIYRVWRVWNTFETNISTFDAMKLTFQIRDITRENTHFYIIPGVKEDNNGTVFWTANPTAIQQLVGITLGNEDPSLDLQNTVPVVDEQKLKELDKSTSGGNKEKIVDFDTSNKPKEGI